MKKLVTLFTVFIILTSSFLDILPVSRVSLLVSANSDSSPVKEERPLDSIDETKTASGIPLFLELEDQSYLEPVIAQTLSEGRLALLFIHASWCHFCGYQIQVLENITNIPESDVRVIGIEERFIQLLPEEFTPEGFPMMFLILGGDENGYLFKQYSGYTEQDTLEADIVYALTYGVVPPNESSATVEEQPGEWPHHTCDTGACMSDCLGQHEDDATDFARSLLEYLVNCGTCSLTLSACCGALAACATIVGCLPAIALCATCVTMEEVAPGPSCSGCVTAFADVLDSASRVSEAVLDCDECCEHPMYCEHGEQGCKADDTPPVGCTLSGLYKTRMTCDDCDWTVDESSSGLIECPEDTHCVETSSTTATCRRNDENEDADDDDDDDDDDGDGGGGGGGDGGMSGGGGEGGGSGGGPSPGPGGDWPDDNDDPSVCRTPEDLPGCVAERPRVAILERGYFMGAQSMLQKEQYPVSFVDLRFTDEMVSQYDVLMIPSGGFYGLSGSELIREKLERYVDQGGTLIVMSQQNGEEYDLLPGGSVSGYGWSEDQSCYSYSAAMSHLHPILSGFQVRQFYSTGQRVVNLKVDGYFTGWPLDTDILLSRTKNNMPCMMIYEHGEGRVIATSMFMDFAEVKWSMSIDERILIHNMISWALNPIETPDFETNTDATVGVEVSNPMVPMSAYPEFSLGETVTLHIIIENPSTEASSDAVFLLLDPKFNLHQVQVDAVIPAGETQAVEMQFQTSTDSPEGIWYVVHQLQKDGVRLSSGAENCFILGVGIDEHSTYKVVFTTMNPLGEVQGSTIVTDIVYPGATETFPITITGDKRGIWTVDYVVYDYRGNIVDFGEKTFSVSDYTATPGGWTYKGNDVTVTIQSEEVGVPDDTMEFTFLVNNQADEEKEVFLSWGRTNEWEHRTVDFGGKSYSDLFYPNERVVTVPAGETISFTENYPLGCDFVKPPKPWECEIFGLHTCFHAMKCAYIDKTVGNTVRTVLLMNAPVDLSVEIDKDVYIEDEEVTVTAEMENRIEFKFDANFEIEVLDPTGDVVLFDSYQESFGELETKTKIFTFNVPNPADQGKYTVTLVEKSMSAYYSQPYQLEKSQKYFTVEPFIASLKSTNIPDIVLLNTDVPIEFVFENLGSRDITDGELFLLFTGETTGSWVDHIYIPTIPVGGTQTVSTILPIGDLEAGEFQLKYDMRYVDKKIKGSILFSAEIITTLSLDQSSYRAGGTMDITVDALNHGNVALDVQIDVDSTELSLDETSYLSLSPGDVEIIILQGVQVPPGLAEGEYMVDLTTTIGVASDTRSYSFSVPSPKLSLSLDTLLAEAGTSFDVNIENVGGAATSFSGNARLKTSGGVPVIDEAVGDTLAVVEVKQISLLMPSSLASGPYMLTVFVEDLTTMRKTTFRETIQVSGVEATLELETDEETYLTSEAVEAWATVVNGDDTLSDAVLHMEVNGRIETGGPETWRSYFNPFPSEVFSIGFDGDGDLMVGTAYGTILWFDGDESTSHTTDLPNRVSVMHRDGSGTLWAGTDYFSSDGISYWDGAQWVKITESTGGLVSGVVYDIDSDSSGNLWVGTKYGLNKFDGTTWTLYDTSSGLQDNHVAVVAVDDDDNVWVTGNDEDEYGVAVFDGTDWTTYTTVDGLASNEVYCIAFDSQNNAWIGTKSGLNVYDGTDWTRYTTTQGLLDNRVLSLAIDGSDNVWAVTYDGMCMWDGLVWTGYTPSDSEIESEDFNAIEVDDADRLWVSYDGARAVSYFDGSTWPRYVPDIIGNTIQDIEMGPSDDVVVSTQSGMSWYDGATWTQFYMANSGLQSNIIRDAAFDSVGGLWVGDHAGVSYYDGTDWTQYNSGNTGGEDLSALWTIAPDPFGSTWFGSTNRGLYRFDGNTWTHYNASNSDLLSDTIIRIKLDATGKLWIASYLGGVNTFDGTTWESFTTAEGLSDNDIYDLDIAPDSSVWVANRYGLDIYDGSDWSQIPDTEFPTDTLGDQVVGQNINRLSIADNGDVWLCTGRVSRGFGAVKYSGGTWTIYDMTNSGISSYHPRHLSFRDNEIWIGSSIGVDVMTQAAGDGSTDYHWETDVTVTQAMGETQTYAEDVGVIGHAGRFVLSGTLTTQEGYLLGAGEYPFYLVKGDAHLSYTLAESTIMNGAPVTFNGQVVNYGATGMTDAIVVITEGGSQVYSASLDVTAGGYTEFTAGFPSGVLGTHGFTVSLSYGGATTSYEGEYEVVDPSLDVRVVAPTIVGWESFNIHVYLNNTGSVPLSLVVDESIPVSLAPGERELVTLSEYVTEDTDIDVVVTGDVAHLETVSVQFGPDASVAFTPEAVCLAGVVTIPYEVINTGLLDTEFTVSTELDGLPIEDIELFLSVGQTISGEIILQLTSGQYTFSYSSVYGSGSHSLEVVGLDQVELHVTQPYIEESKVKIPYTVENVGVNQFEGAVRVRSDIHLAETDVAVDVGVQQGFTYEIPLILFATGDHVFTVQVLKNGLPIHEETVTATVTGPDVSLVSVDAPQMFTIGDHTSISFDVTNTGDQMGQATVKLSVEGVYADHIDYFLQPGDTETLSFEWDFPDDMDSRTVRCVYTFNGEESFLDIPVQGVEVEVESSLDEPLYNEGDIAVLSMTVTNLNDLTLDLIGSVEFGEHSEEQVFSLDAYGAEILTFDVPVVFGDAPKIKYSVHLLSGRSLYINSFNLNQAPSPEAGIIIYTDRDQYKIGDTVTVHIETAQPGVVKAWTREWEIEETVDGEAEYTFEVQAHISGTKYVRYEYGDYAGMYPFDVDGYTAHITDIALDKDVYSVGDTLHMNVELWASHATDAVMLVTLYDQYFNPVESFTVDITLAQGVNVIGVDHEIAVGGLGVYAVNPRIYVDIPNHSLVLLVAGSHMFDVTTDPVPPVVTIISPESNTYGVNTVLVNYTINEDTQWVKRSLDSGSLTVVDGAFMLSALSNGQHTVTIYASDTSGNEGSKNIQFNIDVTPSPSITPSGGEEIPLTTLLSPLVNEPFNVTDRSFQITWTNLEKINPNGYEIYISAVLGILGEKVAYVTDGTHYTVTGLNPKKNYYVTVRAVYDSYNIDSEQIEVETEKRVNPILLSQVNNTINIGEYNLVWIQQESTVWTGYKVDNGDFVEIENGSTLIELSEGSHLIILMMLDAEGYAEYTRFTVTVDLPKNQPPEIIHFPVDSALEGYPIEIAAVIRDDDLVNATLYYGVDFNFFTELPLEKCSGCIDTFEAIIPSDQGYSQKLYYYLTASDTDTIVWHPEGAPQTYHTVDVNLKPTTLSLIVNDVKRDQFTVSWNQLVDPDFKNYTLYLSNSPGTTGEYLGSITEQGLTNYIINGLNYDSTYYVTLRVYDHAGLYSDSVQFAVKTLKPSNFTTISVAIILLSVFAALYIRYRNLRDV